MLENINMKKVWTIHKFEDQESYEKGIWYDKSIFKGNVLLNEGITVLQDLLIGNANTAYNNANAHIGVGNDATAASATDTGLIGASTAYQPMESGYPSINGQTTTWRAAFDGSTANFAWEEFTISNATDNTGDNLNRKVSSEGTKSSGQVWTLDIDITWS